MLVESYWHNFRIVGNRRGPEVIIEFILLVNNWGLVPPLELVLLLMINFGLQISRVSQFAASLTDLRLEFAVFELPFNFLERL